MDTSPFYCTISRLLSLSTDSRLTFQRLQTAVHRWYLVPIFREGASAPKKRHHIHDNSFLFHLTVSIIDGSMTLVDLCSVSEWILPVGRALPCELPTGSLRLQAECRRRGCSHQWNVQSVSLFLHVLQRSRRFGMHHLPRWCPAAFCYHQPRYSWYPWRRYSSLFPLNSVPSCILIEWY